jgi:HlyD family secretion protein
MTLPREALHDEGTKHFVFRVEGGRLEKATVEIGLVNAMRAEITKGIRKDDQIAVHSEGGETLRSGVRVKRQGAG